MDACALALRFNSIEQKFAMFISFLHHFSSLDIWLLLTTLFVSYMDMQRGVFVFICQFCRHNARCKVFFTRYAYLLQTQIYILDWQKDYCSFANLRGSIEEEEKKNASIFQREKRKRKSLNLINGKFSGFFFSFQGGFMFLFFLFVL